MNRYLMFLDSEETERRNVLVPVLGKVQSLVLVPGIFLI